jgi:hypothetical protein
MLFMRKRIKAGVGLTIHIKRSRGCDDRGFVLHSGDPQLFAQSGGDAQDPKQADHRRDTAMLVSRTPAMRPGYEFRYDFSACTESLQFKGNNHITR